MKAHPCSLIACCFIIASARLLAQAPDADGWTTIFSNPDELRSFPNVRLENGLLYHKGGNTLLPQPSPDGAVRARVHFLPGTRNVGLRLRTSANTQFAYGATITTTSVSLARSTPDDRYYKTAVTDLPKPIPEGQSALFELSVVGDLLTIKVDNAIIVQHKDATIPGTSDAHWGVVANEGWFSDIQVKAFAPGTPPPAPSRLATLQAAYQTALQNEVLKSHLEAIAALNSSYTAALERALAAATKRGSLDDAVLIRDEGKRINSGTAMPADAASDPAALKPLRATYRAAFAKLEAIRDQNAAPLKAAYEKALTALQSELTKAGDLDGALGVKAVREALSQSASPVVTSVSSTPSRQPTTAKAKSAKYDPDAAMKIIDWLFTCKGAAVVSTDGGRTTKEIKSAEDLPKGRFELLRVFHGHSSQTVPEAPFPWATLDGVPTLLELRLRQKQSITTADVAHLAALSELSILHLPGAVIEPEAFDAFPANPKLIHLIIYGTKLASEESLTKLAARHPNLENLDLNRSLSVSPALVRACAPLKKLTRLCTSGVVDAEVTKAIGSLTGLREWIHTIGRVDEGMPTGVLASSLKNLTRLSLGDMPNIKVLVPDIIKLDQLWHLGIEHGGMEAPEVEMLAKLRVTSLALADNKTLGDDALAIIATMRSVKFLDLRGTTVITDAGLQHLARMKQLEQVQLGPSQITQAGVAALKKALPNCRVQH